MHEANNRHLRKSSSATSRRGQTTKLGPPAAAATKPASLPEADTGRAMSRENVELIRHVFEMWNRGDLAAWGLMHHPDVVVIPPDGWPEGEQVQSRDEWLAQAMRLTDSWEDQRIEIQTMRDAGDTVVVVFDWITRGKGSHIDLVSEMACVATVRDGLIARLAYFLDRAEALTAVGLRQ